MNKDYWSSRYKKQQTGWDIGEASRPLIHLFETIENKNLKILIPGCGNAYEADYLYHIGFRNVFIMDIALEPLNEFRLRNRTFPESHILQEDFFKHQGKYDLIVEQTFFCAISPELRQSYVEKCFELLKDGGKLIGVLFDREFEGGPPFGGNKNEYLRLFKTHFEEVLIQNCYHSIKPRAGSEIIITCDKAIS
tara:strand:+ start:725 stop:1303 length:579 start_codon:yes stop_codon:yes gene_type:complete